MRAEMKYSQRIVDLTVVHMFVLLPGLSYTLSPNNFARRFSILHVSAAHPVRVAGYSCASIRETRHGILAQFKRAES